MSLKPPKPSYPAPPAPAAVHPGPPEGVVALAALRVGQDLVGLVDLLESRRASGSWLTSGCHCWASLRKARLISSSLAPRSTPSTSYRSRSVVAMGCEVYERKAEPRSAGSETRHSLTRRRVRFGHDTTHPRGRLRASRVGDATTHRHLPGPDPGATRHVRAGHVRLDPRDDAPPRRRRRLVPVGPVRPALSRGRRGHDVTRGAAGRDGARRTGLAGGRCSPTSIPMWWSSATATTARRATHRSASGSPRSSTMGPTTGARSVRR